MKSDELKTAINKLAFSLGFELCRITRPKIDTKHIDALDQWVQQGMQGEMAWMAEEGRLGRRKDPAYM
ncbi:MAG: tRNA epoxyqueuosine(34) reductase QueG, partial [Mariprofundaceae bacterium]|nr:tRNA epoxyqueuosine(34) reductase QueG [Mariprofundaceae bacterium]